MFLFNKFNGVLGLLTAISRFSFTDKFSNTLGLWNFLPTPNLAILCSLLPTNDFPLKITEPLEGLTFPVITSKKVVFPAPLGPITARSSPLLRLKFKLFNAKKPSKLTVILIKSKSFSFLIIL